MYVYVYFQLIVLVYKDEQQKIQITLCKKSTDKQSYLHAKSNHPVSLKKSIPSSQILRVKRICSTNSEFERNRKVLHEQFTKRGYDSSSIETKIKKIRLLDRKDLLTPKTTQKAQVLPLTVTYNCTLSNIKQLIQNHQSILKTNKALEKTFSAEQIITFRENKSLKHFIANKMDGYLQFSTKSTAKAILSSVFQNLRSVTYNM